MPLINDALGLAFFSIPKVASTSLKRVFYKLETGREFDRAENHGKTTHDLYPTRRLHASDWEPCTDHWKFTVVRDPIKSILSAYSNRVLFHKELERGPVGTAAAALLGLGTHPDLNAFCLALRRYRLFSNSIRHHTNKFSAYIGNDLSRFDAVYRLEDLDDLAQDLSARTGQIIQFQRTQTGGQKFTLDDLSPSALHALLDFTASDYDLLTGIYQRPDRPA